MLHQILARVHHEHSNVKHTSINNAEHSHHYEHHDTDSNESFDLLGLLFGIHAHIVQSDNVLVTKNVFKQQKSVKIVVTNIASAVRITNREPDLQAVWQHPPNPTKSPFACSVSLRGAPSLGI